MANYCKPLSHFPDDKHFRGWILYDDYCGFCRRWVPFWRTTLVKRGFDIAPLQADWVQEKFNLSHDTLIDELRLLLRDGRKIQGANVYRYVMRNIWWAFPLYLFSITPGTRLLFDWGYRTFANNRYRFSKMCRLPGSTAKSL